MDIELWKKRRKELGLTLDQLSALSGVSRRTVAGIFANDPSRCSPTLNTIQAIEKALGIDANHANHAKRSLTSDEEEILDKVHEVLNKHGEKGKSLILDYCNLLLEKPKK